MNEELHQALLGAARARSYLRYSQVGTIVGLDMREPGDRAEIGRLLDQISEGEHANGRPLLSAVVIHVQDNMPGNGFFAMARRVGRFAGGDELQFWLAEINAVWQQWSAAAEDV